MLLLMHFKIFNLYEDFLFFFFFIFLWGHVILYFIQYACDTPETRYPTFASKFWKCLFFHLLRLLQDGIIHLV